MARTRTDLLPVTLHDLSVSAFYRVWIKLGFGVTARARRTPQGFDIRIRYGKDDTIKRSSVGVREVALKAVKQLRPTLVCSGCDKPASKNLYLGSDFKFRCAKCLGVPQWKIRTPMTWNLGDEVKFRRLLRRKLDQDVIKFEVAALKTLTPEEFFKSRPYLMPGWVAKVEALDANLYRKLLKVLHGKLKSVMMRRRVQLLSDAENEWFMNQLQVVFSRAAIVTRKEITWLKNRESQLRSQMSPSGSQLGSRSDQSSSQPSVTDCSSKKTSSSLDTNVELVAAQASENAPNALAQDTIPAEVPTSSALIAPTEE